MRLALYGFGNVGRALARMLVTTPFHLKLLLDSNVDGNSAEDRELTARLYGGDHRVRIRQELLLGVGGVRALAAMGIAMLGMSVAAAPA